MSATSEPFQNPQMKISLALNVVLAIGIAALLLSAAEAPNLGSRLSRGTPTATAADEVAYAGKLRPSAQDAVKKRGRYKRAAEPQVTSGAISPAVTYKSVSRARAKKH